MKSGGYAKHLESAAIICLVSGFVIYVAIDTGTLQLDHFKSKSASKMRTPASATSALQRLEEMDDKINFVESTMNERMENLETANQELIEIREKIQTEKAYLASLRSMVNEVGRARAEIASLPALPSSSELVKTLFQLVLDSGFDSSQLRAQLNPSDKSEYLRILDGFEFQEEGIYLLPEGIAKAESLIESAHAAKISRIKVFYRVSEDDSETRNTRERAHVLASFLRQASADEIEVELSRNALKDLAPGAIEVWMGNNL